MKRELFNKICIVCGSYFKCKTDKRVCCSDRCYHINKPYKRKERKIKCAICKAEFKSKTKRKNCNNCLSKIRLHNVLDVKKICVRCGNEFMTFRQNKKGKFCSASCVNALKRMNMSGNAYKYIRNNNYKTAIDFDSERINYLKVFKDFNYKCHLCGDIIDMGIKWPNRMSATIDHVIPISKGGDHTYDNVKPAHFICNLLKGNDYEVNVSG